MNDNILTVTSPSGESLEIEVIDIIDTVYEGVEKEYIIYNFVGVDDMYISILDKSNGEYNIINIDSDEEYEYIQDAIKENIVGE